MGAQRLPGPEVKHSLGTEIAAAADVLAAAAWRRH